MMASWHGYTETVSVLIVAKADPNITDEVNSTIATVCTIVTWCIMLQYGDTALHKAATGGKVEIINLLLNHGAAMDIRNKVEPISALL